MSTILEALKKSEEERQRNEVRRLVDSPLPPERSYWPGLILGLFVLLVCVGLIALWFFLESQSGRELMSSSGSVTQSETVTADEDWRVSVLTYAEDPKARFAIINDNMFREGDYLQAGTKVIAIDADKVVLDVRGKRLEVRP